MAGKLLILSTICGTSCKVAEKDAFGDDMRTEMAASHHEKEENEIFKAKKLNSHVKDLSDHRQEDTGGQQCFPLEAALIRAEKEGHLDFKDIVILSL